MFKERKNGKYLRRYWNDGLDEFWVIFEKVMNLKRLIKILGYIWLYTMYNLVEILHVKNVSFYINYSTK